MSAHPSLSVQDLPEKAAAEDARRYAALRTTMRNQRIQDFFFHKITLLFAATVLAVLIGIIISLAIGAAPAFSQFGPGFITRVEWDPVNDEFGAMIAIWGTLATSIIALAVAFP
ncbi:MAG: phosphate ABC transporter permease subunit PstC, partial [Massilia sp.]